jgi:hypothetical protein
MLSSSPKHNILEYLILQVMGQNVWAGGKSIWRVWASGDGNMKTVKVKQQPCTCHAVI